MQNEQGRARPGFEVVVVFQTRHEPGVVPAAETECPDKEVGGRNIPQRQQIAEPLVFPVSPRPSQRSNGLACDQAGQDRGQSDRQHQRGCAAQSIDQPVTQEIQRGNQREEYGDRNDRTSMEIHVATFLSSLPRARRSHAVLEYTRQPRRGYILERTFQGETATVSVRRPRRGAGYGDVISRGTVPMPGYRRGFSTRRSCLFEAFTAVTATEGVFHVSTIDSPDRIIRHPIRARLAPAALFRGSSANPTHRLTSYQFPSARNRSDSSAGSPVNASRKNAFNFPFFSAGSPNGECDSCTQEASVRLM